VDKGPSIADGDVVGVKVRDGEVVGLADVAGRPGEAAGSDLGAVDGVEAVALVEFLGVLPLLVRLVPEGVVLGGGGLLQDRVTVGVWG